MDQVASWSERQLAGVEMGRHRDKGVTTLDMRQVARRIYICRAPAQDEVPGMEARLGDAVEDDKIATAEIDRGGAVHFVHRVHHRLEIGETERREIDLVGAGEEIADHIAAGAMLEHKGIGTA